MNYPINLNEPFDKDLVETILLMFCSYCFYVFLNPFLIDDMKAEVIKRIIEKEKPAHTVGIVRRLPMEFSRKRQLSCIKYGYER